MREREVDSERAPAQPLWMAMGAALVGVLLGGAAVFLGLTGRPPSALPSAAPAACCDGASESPPMRVEGATPSLVDAVARTREAVVTLRGGQGLLGTGVIVDPAGLVLTNFHVIAPQLRDPGVGLGGAGVSLVVRFANGRELPAILLVGDREQDLAVLRLRPADTAETFRAARLGRSSELAVGQPIFVVGAPLGLEQTVSSGIVAALDRTHILANRRLSLVQIDASINFGSSGGPLFNLEGELVGITTAMIERAQGIGFAIPSDHIRAILKTFGQGDVRRSGQIGVEASADIDLSEAAYRLGYRNGVVVTEVVAGLPAERAGLRAGDVLVEIRGRRFDAFGEGPEARRRFAQNFVDTVRATVPGERLEVTVIREGARVQLALEVAAASAEHQVTVDAEELLGLVLEADAPVVRELRAGAEISGWTSAERLRGARITQIIGRPVTSLADLGAALADLRQHLHLGARATIAVGFALADGTEILVQDFPIARA